MAPSPGPRAKKNPMNRLQREKIGIETGCPAALEAEHARTHAHTIACAVFVNKPITEGGAASTTRI